MQIYPPETILARKAERSFFGLGKWKQTYTFEYAKNCGFNVADLDPVVLLKSLLITCGDSTIWNITNHYANVLFNATKGNRKTIYRNDDDYGLTKYIVMLDLFPLELMKISMKHLFRYLLGGDGGDNWNTYRDIWKPGEPWTMPYLLSVRDELSLHVEHAIRVCEERRHEKAMKTLRKEFLTTYFDHNPEILLKEIGLDKMIDYMKHGDRVIDDKNFNEVYSVLFDHPRVVPGANIPCSGCFIETYTGPKMKCKLHGYVVVQEAPQPSAPPAAWNDEYGVPPKLY